MMNNVVLYAGYRDNVVFLSEIDLKSLFTITIFQTYPVK